MKKNKNYVIDEGGTRNESGILKSDFKIWEFGQCSIDVHNLLANGFVYLRTRKIDIFK